VYTFITGVIVSSTDTEYFYQYEYLSTCTTTQSVLLPVRVPKYLYDHSVTDLSVLTADLTQPY